MIVAMARLQDDEIAHYRREGWVVPRYRLPAERVARMVEALLRANPGVRPEKLVPRVLGEDVILWGWHVFCKPAKEGFETPWHQDGHYWPIRPSPRAPRGSRSSRQR
jgi:hypothetical protein